MINVGMSTSCVYPKTSESAFALAQRAGSDGIEVMVSIDPVTRDADSLLALSARYEQPILSVHAPVLLFTQLIWGASPRVKLERSAALARELGATTVVVHPPFLWQYRYARAFLDVIRDTSAKYGVEIAVENMFTWRVGGRELKAYLPGWDPSGLDYDAMTLDFSHAAMSGRDSLELAHAMGGRLRHVHLCDGSGSTSDGKVFDQHLLPGRGTEPVAEVISELAGAGWSGSLIAEVKTHAARSDEERVDIMTETFRFARTAIAAGARSTVPVR
jgi:sugar phosphate isomerase/epimerase